jgi:cytochrome P450
MYPPADPFRESPQTETEVAGQTIPANAIVRVDAKALHKKYTKALEASGKKLKPMDLVTFGEGLRKCAGYSLAMTELITFFDEFKKHVASVRYAGEDKDKYAVKQGLSTKPKDGTVEVTAKTQ